MTRRIHQISVSNGGVPKLAIESAKIGLQGVVGDYQADQKTTDPPNKLSVSGHWR